MVAWGGLDDVRAPRPSDISYRARKMTERELEAAIVALIAARPDLKLKIHGADDRKDRSDPGWPDMVIGGPGGFIFRENKRVGEQPSPDQLAWGGLFVAAGLDWAIWTPVELLAGQIQGQLDRLAADTI